MSRVESLTTERINQLLDAKASSVDMADAIAEQTLLDTAIYAPHTYPHPFAPVVDTRIERWQSGHGWTASNLTIVDDTSQVGLGTQSLKVTTISSDFSYVRKTGITALNLVGKHLRLWVVVPDISTWGSGGITVLAASSSGLWDSNYMSWAIVADTVAAGGQPNSVIFTPGELVCVDLPLSQAWIVGTPDITELTDFQISVDGSASGRIVYLCGLDAVTTDVARYPNGVVTICFDDAYDGQWNYARAALDKWGYAATLFPIVENIGTNGSMTLAQMHALHDTRGWEVGAHSMTLAVHQGYGTLSQSAIHDDMIANIKWLSANGFGSTAYAYPLGYFSTPAVKSIAKGLFVGARSINGAMVETVPTSNPSRLRSNSGIGGLGGLGVTTEESGTYSLLYDAAANSDWVILTMHQVTAATSDNINKISAADLQILVDSIHELGMEVATMSDVLLLAEQDVASNNASALTTGTLSLVRLIDAVPFCIEWSGSAWPARTTVSSNVARRCFFVGNPGGSAPTDMEELDIWTQG